MQHDLVHALSKFGKTFGSKYHADAAITRLPALAAIVGAINSGRRHGHGHTLFVAGIENNCVQAQSAITRPPTRSMWMVEEPAHQRPRTSSVARLEECRRIDAAIQHVGFVCRTESELPDVFERSARILRELNVGFRGCGPRLPEIISRVQITSPVAIG